MNHAQTIIQLLEQLRDRPLEERQSIRRGYDFATRLFAGRYRACGRPFVSHLIGTASALARHGAALDGVLAGLLHAAYEQGEFPSKRSRREQLRNVIGDGAERLVHAYQNFDWSRVPDQLNDEDQGVVSIRIANEVDECGDRSMLYVGPRKRTRTTAGVPGFVAAARQFGMSELADELESSLAENLGEPEPGLAGDHNGSFTLTPPVRSILRARFKRARRALKRTLRGR